MVGSRRWVGAALTGLSLITGTGVVGGTVATLSPDPIAGSATVQDKPSGAQEPDGQGRARHAPTCRGPRAETRCGLGLLATG